MRTQTTPRAIAAGVATILTTVALVSPAAASTSDGPTSDDPRTLAETVGDSAAWWIDAQFNEDGAVIGRTGVPDVPNTIAATLGLDATGHVHGNLAATIAYVEAGLDDYVAGAFADDYGPAGSGDRPGALANLLLFVHAVGLDANDFGGSDLVARLEATEQQLGPDVGSYGAQLDVFGHGYAHATILWAMTTSPAAEPSDAAVDHLLDLQCQTGGFPSGYRSAVQRLLDNCTGDSNATGLALAALAQLDGHDAVIDDALAFLEEIRNEDGGWGYTPGDATDGNSTGLAALGRRLAGQDVTRAVEAIRSLQFDCTANAGQIGGVRFLAGDDEPNSFSTYQSMLALDLDLDDEPEPTEPCAAAPGDVTSNPTGGEVIVAGASAAAGDGGRAEPAPSELASTGAGATLTSGLLLLLAFAVRRPRHA